MGKVNTVAERTQKEGKIHTTNSEDNMEVRDETAEVNHISQGALSQSDTPTQDLLLPPNTRHRKQPAHG